MTLFATIARRRVQRSFTGFNNVVVTVEAGEQKSVVDHICRDPGSGRMAAGTVAGRHQVARFLSPLVDAVMTRRTRGVDQLVMVEPGDRRPGNGRMTGFA